MSPRSLLPLLLSLVFLLSSASASSTPVEYCNATANYPVQVYGVQISPYPVKGGKTTKFTISASTGDCIEAGKLVIDVSYLGWVIHEETHDLCAEVENSCPIHAGDFNLSHSAFLPIFTPPGTYTLKMDMLGESSKQLSCITFQFSISFWAEADGRAES